MSYLLLQLWFKIKYTHTNTCFLVLAVGQDRIFHKQAGGCFWLGGKHYSMLQIHLFHTSQYSVP